MGDPRRFHHMAGLVEQIVPASSRIADVASGKGYLRAALHQRGYRRVESWDRRPRCAGGRGYRYGYFDWRSAPRDYDAVIAMHPDGGTDHALLYAGERGVPGLVCPCCITPSAATYWGKHSYLDWCDHLESLVVSHGGRAQWIALPIMGRNRVLLVNGSPAETGARRPPLRPTPARVPDNQT